MCSFTKVPEKSNLFFVLLEMYFDQPHSLRYDQVTRRLTFRSQINKQVQLIAINIWLIISRLIVLSQLGVAVWTINVVSVSFTIYLNKGS